MMLLTEAAQPALLQPIDLTQIFICLITTLGGALVYWLTGKRVGRAEATIDAGVKSVDTGVQRATYAAELAKKHADIVIQASMRPPEAPRDETTKPDVKSIAPRDMQSDPPTTLREPPRPPPTSKG